MTPEQVKEPCRRLRARSPQEWDEFVAMFHEYTAEAIDAVCQADAGEIMTQKGRALAVKGLLHAFLHLDPPQSQVQGHPAPIPAAAGP